MTVAPSRTLKFAPHALSHIFDFTCLLTTTSDSFIVRMVGVEPTILTTIGIRLLSMARLTRSLFFHTVVDFSPARTYCRFPDPTEFRGIRFLSDPLPEFRFWSGTFPHYHKPTVHLHTRVCIATNITLYHNPCVESSWLSLQRHCLTLSE